MAERISSKSKILEKQACFFDKAVAQSLHDPKPENVPQESWDKKVNFSAALLHGATARDIGGNYGNNINYVHASVREVLSRLYWNTPEESRPKSISVLFDTK